MISVNFQGKPFNVTVIQVYALASNGEEAEIGWFYEDLHKASGGDGIPVDLFQILKDDALKVLHSICQQIWRTQQWPQDWKRSVFSPIPRKAMPKKAQTITQLFSSDTLVKKCSKFSKPGFSNT